MCFNFHYEEVLPDIFYDEPEFMVLYSLRIPKKLANNFSKLVNGDHFTRKYPHLKRMRKVSEIENIKEGKRLNCSDDNLMVEILIGETFNDLPIEADIFLKQNEINKIWNKLILPRSPPLTREKCLELSKYWPLSFLKPRWTPEILSQDMQLKANKFVKIALSIGKIAQGKGNPDRGCVITLRGKIVAIGEDSRNSGYPWMHSVMSAIHNFSQRIGKSNNDNFLYNWNHENNEEMKDQTNHDISLFNKDEILPYSELKDQYLCTNGIVYLSHEPCISCSMALVHSRISKVFYMYKDTEKGFLGSRHKLHCVTQLNHHYRVYSASQLNN